MKMKDDIYIDSVLEAFSKQCIEKPIEQRIKEGVIAECRYMDKADIYEWIASDEVERYKQKEEISRLNNIIDELEKDIKQKINDIKNNYSQVNGNYFNMNYVIDTYEDVLDKLKELKEGK